MAAIGVMAASIATTVAFVRRHPDAAESLSTGRIAFLGGVRGGRLAPHPGVGAALMFALGVLALIHGNHDALVPLWLLYGPIVTFGAPAFTAAAADRSFRAGVQAGTWTAITVMPLTVALLLAEASRQYANNGAWLFAGDVTTAGSLSASPC